MIKRKNYLNESCSSNLVFLSKKYFQRDSVAISPQKFNLNFENALFLLNHFKILVRVGKNKYVWLISAQNWTLG